METISIIVPVYKVEKYLDRCVSSLVNQTYKNLEIILVDDGSPDNCGKMCDGWAKKDERIKVVHKENGGLGYARNSGLEVATGKYVMFVDSDDYILEHTCEVAMNALISNNAQICYYGHLDDFDGVQSVNTKKPDRLIYSKTEVIDFFLADALAQHESTTILPFVIMSACCALYDLSIIKDNDIRFLSERDYLNEDLFFRTEICKYINKAVVLPENLYCYCHNGTSLSTSYRKDRFESSLRMYDKLTEVLSDYMDRADIADRCKRAFMNNIIVCLKQEVVYLKSRGIRNLRKKYKQIVDDKTVAEVMRSYPIKKLPKQQRWLFEAIKYKNVAVIFILVKIKDLINRKKVKI